MKLTTFLSSILGEQIGWVRTARRDRKARGIQFRETFVRYPNDIDGLASLAERCRREYVDAYFCPHLFMQAKGTKDFAKRGRTLWADLDNCPPSALGRYGEPPPTYVIETSPQRYQAFWVLEHEVSPNELADMNKRIYLGYRKFGCDSCWSLTHLLRLPSTYNCKRDEPFKIRLPESSHIETVSYEDLGAALPILPAADTRIELELQNMTMHVPLEQLSGHRKRLWEKDVEQGERSEHLYRLVVMLALDLRWGDGAILKALYNHPLFIEKFPDKQQRLADIKRCLEKVRSRIKRGGFTNGTKPKRRVGPHGD